MRSAIPLIRVQRRLEVPRRVSAAVSAFFILLSFAAAALIFELMGVSSVATFGVIASVFTNPNLLLQAILRGLPIGLAALGLSIAFRMNFWNIGAEGQLYMGMFAATGVVLLHEYQGLIAEPLVIVFMVLASFVAGGLYCALSAALKAKMGVNEVLTTLMLNYIAILFVDFLVYGPWRDPKGFNFPLSIQFPDYARLGFVLGSPSYEGLAMLLVVAFLVYGLMRHTTLGFEMRVVGESPEVAKHAGISYAKALIIGGFISGGLAGIAGFSVVSGIIGRLRPRASPGYGYTAIIVAFLALLNPWLIIPASIFFGGLIVAGDLIQASLKLPFAAVQIFQSIIFLFIIAGEFMKRYRIIVSWR
ncbi:MAG: ABC transporter permease [Aigarchaeota archaeon]|nr:ABC transporter permease [Candidatus Pelearchaeum maunauluense]